jgi:hypothetical protein
LDLRLALPIQNEHAGQEGAKELCKKQICSGTTVFKDGSEALGSNTHSLWWNISVGAEIRGAESVTTNFQWMYRRPSGN